MSPGRAIGIAGAAARKALGRVLPVLRRLPGFARLELDHYVAIEACLLRQVDALPLARWRRLLPLAPAPVIRQALATQAEYQVIDPHRLDADAAALLEGHGLSRSWLLANIDVIPSAYSKRRPAHDVRPGATDFQRDAVTQRGIEAICPLSGQLLRSDRSLIAEQNQPIYYLFRARIPFFLAVGREGRGYIKLYLYFPTLKTAILLTDPIRWHGRDEIDQIRAHLIAEHRTIERYLGRTDAPVLCAYMVRPALQEPQHCSAEGKVAASYPAS